MAVRYFIELSYFGKAYSGWQFQPNDPSVQQTLEKALSVLLRCETKVVGAGRTDSGVHAVHYIAHFDCQSVIEEQERFCYHLNAVLPRDISANGLRRVRCNAHARFDATSREYEYYIARLKNPFATDTSFRLTVPLDVERMNEAAALLLEQEDFASFCKAHSDNKTTICHLSKACWQERKAEIMHSVGGADEDRGADFLVFTIRSDRFLRNMVRSIVGTLVDVGKGKLSVGQMLEIIEGRDRSLAGMSAPAHGLFFQRAVYPDDVYLE